jgi:hypothetical protein
VFAAVNADQSSRYEYERQSQPDFRPSYGHGHRLKQSLLPARGPAGFHSSEEAYPPFRNRSIVRRRSGLGRGLFLAGKKGFLMRGIGRHRHGEKKPSTRTSSRTITIEERLGAGEGRGRSHSGTYIFFAGSARPDRLLAAHRLPGIIAPPQSFSSSASLVPTRIQTLCPTPPLAPTGLRLRYCGSWSRLLSRSVHPIFSFSSARRDALSLSETSVRHHEYHRQ